MITVNGKAISWAFHDTTEETGPPPPPNILPPDHTRADYDFDYRSGRGPIRMGAIDVPEIPIHVPAKVWCKRHVTWENEIAAPTEES